MSALSTAGLNFVQEDGFREFRLFSAELESLFPLQIVAFNEHEKSSMKRVLRDSFSQVNFCSRLRVTLEALCNGTPGKKRICCTASIYLRKLLQVLLLFLH